MSNLIERAARAIYEARNGAGCRAWASQPKSHREPYLNDARAALSAFRPDIEAWRVSTYTEMADELDAALTPSSGKP
jgi:hypothetical protein